MRRFLASLTVLAVLGVGVFVYREESVRIALQAYHRALPCRTPISYSIGEVDARFDISKTAVIDALAAAEALWEDELGSELFVLSDHLTGRFRNTSAKSRIGMSVVVRPEMNASGSRLRGVRSSVSKRYLHKPAPI